MQSRVVVTAAFLVLAPCAARAQITTFVPPPVTRTADSAKPPLTPAQQRATADSVTRTTLTNMKAWVDSAAGIATPVATDSTTVATTTTATTRTQTQTKHAVTTTFANGAVAPETASPLPLLALLGLAALGVGTIILVGRSGA